MRLFLLCDATAASAGIKRRLKMRSQSRAPACREMKKIREEASLEADVTPHSPGEGRGHLHSHSKYNLCEKGAMTRVLKREMQQKRLCSLKHRACHCEDRHKSQAKFTDNSQVFVSFRCVYTHSTSCVDRWIFDQSDQGKVERSKSNRLALSPEFRTTSTVHCCLFAFFKRNKKEKNCNCTR